MDSLSVFTPNFLSNKWRVCKNKVKIIIELFWNLLGLIEIIFVEISIFITKFLIQLNYLLCTSKTKKPFLSLILSMLKNMLGVDKKQADSDLVA